VSYADDDAEPVDDAPAPDPDEADSEEEEALDEIDAANAESQERVWLRTMCAVVKALDAVSPDSPRVRFAVEQFMTAACERGCRVLRADLPPE
jgi:hypothetical protein